MRRLVVLSILLTLGGLVLLLPNTPFYNLLTTGSASGSVSTRFALATSSPDSTTTTESVLGFGLLGMAAVLQILSLITDVGGAVAAVAVPQPEKKEASP